MSGTPVSCRRSAASASLGALRGASESCRSAGGTRVGQRGDSRRFEAVRRRVTAHPGSCHSIYDTSHPLTSCRAGAMSSDSVTHPSSRRRAPHASCGRRHVRARHSHAAGVTHRRRSAGSGVCQSEVTRHFGKTASARRKFGTRAASRLMTRLRRRAANTSRDGEQEWTLNTEQGRSPGARYRLR